MTQDSQKAISAALADWNRDEETLLGVARRHQVPWRELWDEYLRRSEAQRLWNLKTL